MGASSLKMFVFLDIDNTIVWQNCAKNSTFNVCFHVSSANECTKWHLLPARKYDRSTQGLWCTQLFWRTHYKWRKVQASRIIQTLKKLLKIPHGKGAGGWSKGRSEIFRKFILYGQDRLPKAIKCAKKMRLQSDAFCPTLAPWSFPGLSKSCGDLQLLTEIGRDFSKSLYWMWWGEVRLQPSSESQN